MATAKYYKGGPFDGLLVTATQQTTGAASEGSYFSVSNVFDASKAYSATAGGAAVLAGGGLTAADIVELLAIPANTYVLRVFATVITAEGATQVVNIGDGSTAAGYFSNADMNAAAGTTTASIQSLTEGTPNTFTGYSFGKLYTADDTIDLAAVTNNYNVGKVRVTALCFAPIV